MTDEASPVILRLESDPRNGDRVVVTVGVPEAGLANARTVVLHLAVVAEQGLRTGQPCPPGVLSRLLTAEELQGYYARALNFVAVRPRSEAEVRARLRRHNVPPDAIEAVVARLERTGNLDDVAFARYWIAERARSSPRGPRLLRGELRTKGVAPAVIEQALADFAQEADAAEAAGAAALPPPVEADADDPAADENDLAPPEPREVRDALTLARRKARSYASLDPPTYRRRLGGFLLRRGYGYDVVSRVLRLLAAE